MRSWIAAGTLALVLAVGLAIPAEAAQRSARSGGKRSSQAYSYNRPGYPRYGYGNGYRYGNRYAPYGYGRYGYGRHGYAPYRRVPYGYYAPYGYAHPYGYSSFKYGGPYGFYAPSPYGFYTPPPPGYGLPGFGLSYYGPGVGVTLGIW